MASTKQVTTGQAFFPASQEVSSTTNATTSSTTDELMTGMSITPGAGDFRVSFSGTVSNSGANNSTIVTLYVGGVAIQKTARRFALGGGQTSSMAATVAFTTEVTVSSDTDTIEVRWRASGGTSTVNERNLYVTSA